MRFGPDYTNQVDAAAAAAAAGPLGIIERMALVSALASALRLTSAGGTASVQLPNGTTGELDSLILDRAAASQLVGEFLDIVTDQARGDATALGDRLALLVWRDPRLRKALH